MCQEEVEFEFRLEDGVGLFMPKRWGILDQGNLVRGDKAGR